MTSTPPPAGPGADAGTDAGTGHSTGHGTPGPTWPTDEPAPMGTGPRVTLDQVRDLARLRRITVDRKLGGVAGGIARHLDIDPLVVRVAFVVLSLFGGAGLVMYAAGWILLPEDGEQRQPLGLDDRSRSVALILAGILGAALLVGQWDWFWVPGPLILVALVVWLFLSRRNETSTAGQAPAAPAAPTAPPPGAGPNAVTPDQRWAAPAAYDQPPAYERAEGWTPPPPAQPTRYVSPAPRNPRKRGPKLFWFTMALAALAVGVVGIVDVSGAAVAGSTYPAVVVGVVGVMLLVGAFYGRAGGLILIGLLAAVGTAIGLASEKIDGDRVEDVPLTSAEVLDSYDYGWGEYVLDLTQVTDPEQLDGHTIHLTADAAELDVVVPEDMDVTVHARTNGPGGMTIFGSESGGIDFDRTYAHDGGEDVPQITLDVAIDFGHIDVRTHPQEG